jgi:hypothetical protein
MGKRFRSKEVVMSTHRDREKYIKDNLYRLSLARSLGASSFKIPLTQGKYAVVDIEDAERTILLGMWIATEVKKDTWYAICPVKQPDLNGHWRNESLHQFVMRANGVFVDHIDHDGLNCRKSNLRLTDWVGNNQNATKGRRRHKSIYRGVSWDRTHWRWVARVQHGTKKVFIGYFDNERDAAKAYNIKAKELHGEYANLNKIEEEKK